jgi:hypothetical protein
VLVIEQGLKSVTASQSAGEASFQIAGRDRCSMPCLIEKRK